MTNELADLVYSELKEIHIRVYRNDAPKSPTFPYIVFRLSSGMDSFPTNDYSVDVKIFDKNDGTVSVRTIETIGDTIDLALNNQVLGTTLKAHFKRDIRQFENDSTLSGVQFVNLQYTVRLY